MTNTSMFHLHIEREHFDVFGQVLECRDNNLNNNESPWF